jgi:hypothetical protein
MRTFLSAIAIVSAFGSTSLSAGTDRPSGSDCQAHLNRCLTTRLGKRNPKTPGKSYCASCFDFCVGQGQWPEQLASGTDCRWWNY